MKAMVFCNLQAFLKGLIIYWVKKLQMPKLNVVDFLKNYMKAMVFCNLQAFLKGLNKKVVDA